MRNVIQNIFYIKINVVLIVLRVPPYMAIHAKTVQKIVLLANMINVLHVFQVNISRMVNV